MCFQGRFEGGENNVPLARPALGARPMGFGGGFTTKRDLKGPGFSLSSPPAAGWAKGGGLVGGGGGEIYSTRGRGGGAFWE